MHYPVKRYHSLMTNAPALAGVEGSVISLIQTCLMQGFNTGVVNALVLEGDHVKATVQSGHGFATGDIVLIEGATPSAYNGEARVTVASPSVFTYVPSVLPDADATGSITCKYAPQGSWEIVDGAGSTALLRSTHVQATGRLLYLNDDAEVSPQQAYAYGVEDAAGINDLGPRFPNSGQVADGLVIRKSNESSGESRPWVLIADDMMFYLFTGWTQQAADAGLTSLSTSASADPFWFGDLASYWPSDAYHCAIGGSYMLPFILGVYNYFLNVQGTNQIGQYLARAHTQIEGSIQLSKLGLSPNLSGSVNGLRYAPPGDLLRLRGPVEIIDGSTYTNNPLRGHLPGLYEVLNSAASQVATLDTAFVPTLPGREIMFVRCHSSSALGLAAFDVTGPWR
jgi:hypothetical protein